MGQGGLTSPSQETCTRARCCAAHLPGPPDRLLWASACVCVEGVFWLPLLCPELWGTISNNVISSIPGSPSRNGPHGKLVHPEHKENSGLLWILSAYTWNAVSQGKGPFALWFSISADGNLGGRRVVTVTPLCSAPRCSAPASLARWGK